MTPAGATALVVPVTVAVKITEPPRTKVPGADVSTTLGVPGPTIVEEEEATTPTAL